jgi:hypothetical protein
MSNLLSNKSLNASGFTLIEVIAATFVITLGLFTASAFTGRSETPHRRSKYITLASSLASDKLQDLSRWDANDPNVCVPTHAKSVGSLTRDVIQTTTCPNGAADTVSYFDDVTLSPTGNDYSETIQSTSGGTPVYVTTTHSADGSINITTSDTPPTDQPTFHRRWVIQRDSRASGTRRITVVVTLLVRTVHPPVTLKMTM